MNKKGQGLIVAYMIIVSIAIISAIILNKAIVERNLTLRHRLTREAFYIAEGGVEDAITAFTRAIADYQIATDVAAFNKTTAYSTFSNAQAITTITSLEASDRLVSDDDMNVYVRNYKVSSTASHPENNTITVTVHQIIARKLTPAFQYLAFYDDDLEILPGPDMTLSGKIHSNKDIYMDSNNTLTVDSFYVHSAGDIYNRRKDSSDDMGGDAFIKVTGSEPPQYEAMNGLDSDDPGWESEATARWNGTVQSADHGVIKRTAPSIASIQPDGYYATAADVVVTNGQIEKDGTVLVEGVDYPNGTIITTETLYSAREDTYIRTVDLDLNRLAGYAPGDTPGNPSFPNNLPSNGLLYATRNDTGDLQPGVRLINGGEIHQDCGLTVVSNDPVYIQGDYNTSNEKPASVICDAVNLLSNNWDDSKSPGDLPEAVTTTINCAFVSGIDTTAVGDYNGGFENYPRLHENWSGIDLYIKGSFAALWNSSIATGAWQYGSPQYTAPRRNWEYNTAFNNPDNLPPVTPWAIEAERVAWWKD